MSDRQNGNGRAEEIGAPAGAWEKNVEFDIDVHDDAGAEVSAVPSFQDASLLDDHARAGHELIPLDGKVPVERGWTETVPMDLIKATARVNRGRT